MSSEIKVRLSNVLSEAYRRWPQHHLFLTEHQCAEKRRFLADEMDTPMCSVSFMQVTDTEV